jgi:phosphoribosylamine--glycine ligase
MKICVIGSGGREHALAWKMSQDENVSEIIVIPGNPGMINGKVKIHSLDLNDNQVVSDYLTAQSISFVMIGPEKYLDEGMADELTRMGHHVLGPSRTCALLESSKSFSKDIMNKFKIPTAKAYAFDKYEEALEFVKNWDMSQGIVLKADGLAGGKGVVVTYDLQEAIDTLYDFMQNPNCSVKADTILIEECLTGTEISAFALCDGINFHVLGYASDYKRVFDGDKGPNTGGMGTFSSPKWPSADIKTKVEEQVFAPLLLGLVTEGMPYKGILFAGLMIEKNEINVIEFNVRFGDPETQSLLPLLKGNFSNTLFCAAKGELGEIDQLEVSDKTAVHVVMCSENYPSIDGTPLNTGHKISISSSDNENIFYAGVGCNENNELINTGGRVLGVTCLGDDLTEARVKAYDAISRINFNGAHWRTDIAKLN